MAASPHTIRGCTTAVDLDSRIDTGVRWLVVPALDRDTLYVTHDDCAEAVAHVFTDPAERRALQRILAAILRAPRRRWLSVVAD